MRRITKELTQGKTWSDVFAAVAAIEITAHGTGPSLSLRLSKKEGIPIHPVPEGTSETPVVAVRRVNELDVYNLGAKQLAEKVGLTLPKLITVVDYLNLSLTAPT